MAEHRIFLGGGGNAEQSAVLDFELAEYLDATDGLNSCLYIPAAMNEDSHPAANSWFRENYGHLFDDIDMLGDLSDMESLSKPYGVVYIGGGNTGRLLDQVHQNNFDRYLRWHMDNGGAIYGGSAGAMILGASILTTSAAEHSSHNNDGLNMLGGRSVVAHYDGEAQQIDTVILSRKLKSRILAISEDAGVIVYENNSLRAVGGIALEINPDGSIRNIGR